ncbi:MAG: hypothetical protein GXP30_11400 [Verrucomicrobia bacterium]|nr:hypothetical protein [Verrucomicrobiota bacterium]
MYNQNWAKRVIKSVILMLLLKMAGFSFAEEAFTLVGLLHDDQALNRAHDVELQGDIAYVPGKGGSLAIIDVSDVTKPKLLSSLFGIEGMEDAETVLPMGDILLVGTRDFLAVDVSDPRNPKIVKRISDRPRIDLINGMALRGDFVFSANKTGYVGVFDVKNPANPKLWGVLDAKKNGEMRKPHDVAAFGDHIIVVNADHEAINNAQVYRVADATTHQILPVDQWKIESTITGNGKLGENLNGANRVAVTGSYAGIGAFVRSSVGVIDLKDPTNAKQIANMPVVDIAATGMAAVGQIIFAAGGEGVEAIDISNPAMPVSIAQYRAGKLFPTRRLMMGKTPRFDNAHDLVYRDGYLYVTAQNDNQLGILKVNDPRVLELVKKKMK